MIAQQPFCQLDKKGAYQPNFFGEDNSLWLSHNFPMQGSFVFKELVVVRGVVLSDARELARYQCHSNLSSQKG